MICTSVGSLGCARSAICDAATAAGRFLLGLAAVAAEAPRRGELAQPMADHVFGHEHLQVHLAVVDHERVADELGNDRAGPGPGVDRLLDARSFCRSTLPNSFASTYGPFLSERPMFIVSQSSVVSRHRHSTND